jgi:hypothetical protein
MRHGRSSYRPTIRPSRVPFMARATRLRIVRPPHTLPLIGGPVNARSGPGSSPQKTRPREKRSRYTNFNLRVIKGRSGWQALTWWPTPMFRALVYIIAGIYAMSIAAIVVAFICEHFRKPVGDGHTRAAECDAWGHPMR